MIVNRPALDYVRVTTSEFSNYEKLVYLALGLSDEEITPGKFLQYEGQKRGPVFHGQAIQGDRVNYLAQVSGEASDGGFGMLKHGRCTRIDLQVTIDKPSDFHGRELTDCLRSAPWKGRRRKITLIDGAGDDTVYIGSRTSETFIRIYVKQHDYLRFEVEYKGDMARRIVEALENNTAGQLLRYEIDRLPSCAKLDPFCGILDGGMGVLPERAYPEKVERLKWLSSLIPTFAQMANDHDYGHTVREWFHALSIDTNDE